ncbi:MAG TPA: thioredoxin family protein [Planctomycetaceae bacterium]|nr:thioredoxin family protein [Planctomycetaceae bacterium]
MKVQLATALGLALCLSWANVVRAEGSAEAAPQRKIGELDWHTDYASAYRAAQEQHKQLFIFFRDPREAIVAAAFERNVLAHPELVAPLKKAVRVVVPVSYQMPKEEKEGEESKPAVRLLDHTSFVHMHKKPGLAVIDLVDSKDAIYGQVISAHPFTQGQHYTLNPVKVILGLPRATITQRALVYAVRMHPEAPQSTRGIGHPYMFAQANEHSKLMAQYGSVGHHDWGNRSARVASVVGGGPVEVAGTSWNSSSLNDAARECIEQWRGSGVHWGMVAAPQGKYGYDMVQAPGGAWYATGIFVGN